MRLLLLASFLLLINLLGPLYLLCQPQVAWAQSAFNKISNEPTYVYKGKLFPETIKRISLSRKIFLLTNDNQQVYQGDFVSLVLNNDLVARALVAKVRNDLMAIKVINIYSMQLWNQLKKNGPVKILRGDDSFYKTAVAKAPTSANPDQDAEDSSILSEEELFDKSLDKINENEKRVIKPDNLIGASYGQIESLGANGGDKFYPHLSLQWAYQFQDNFLGELTAGQTKLSGFPSDSLSTQVTDITVRFKYTKDLPFFFYILPFVGYKFLNAKSADAGVQNTDGTLSDADLAREKSLVEEAGKDSFVFGVTFLKRLVPGWFAKADISLDLYNIGFAIEF